MNSMAPKRSGAVTPQRAAFSSSSRGESLRHTSPVAAPHPAAASVPRRRAAAVAPAAAQSVRMADMSAQMASVRAQMEENEQLSVLMAGLRGSNMNDEDFADQNVVMQLISVTDSDGEVRCLTNIYIITQSFKVCSVTCQCANCIECTC